MTNIFENSTNSNLFKDYATKIDEKGYIFLPKALSQDFISNIKKDISKHRNNFNNNRLGGVSLRTQYFNTFLLAISRSFYNYCTSKFVLELSNQIFQRDDFRLKALRFYETSSGHNMQWHTDTKTPEGFKSIPGIIFICYVSDVPKGEFQYIEGSHKWSQKKLDNDFDEDFINKHYSKRIKSFKGSSRDLIIYNTAGIHRASPYHDKSFTRSSLFFQVDCENNSEPIYLNSSFIDPSNKKIMKYLGFGEPSNYKEYPICSADFAPTKLILRQVIFPKSKRLLIELLKFLLPIKQLKILIEKFKNLKNK